MADDLLSDIITLLPVALFIGVKILAARNKKKNAAGTKKGRTQGSLGAKKKPFPPAPGQAAKTASPKKNSWLTDIVAAATEPAEFASTVTAAAKVRAPATAGERAEFDAFSLSVDEDDRQPVSASPVAEQVAPIRPAAERPLPASPAAELPLSSRPLPGRLAEAARQEPAVAPRVAVAAPAPVPEGGDRSGAYTFPPRLEAMSARKKAFIYGEIFGPPKGSL